MAKNNLKSVRLSDETLRIVEAYNVSQKELQIETLQAPNEIHNRIKKNKKIFASFFVKVTCFAK